MNAVLALLKLRNGYSLVPNPAAIQTRSYGMLLQPLPEDPKEHTHGSVRESVGTFDVWHHSQQQSVSAARPATNAQTVRDDDDECTCHCAYCAEEEERGFADSGRRAVPKESTVFREPQTQFLSREALWRKYQSDDGAPFSPLVNDMRYLCMQRRKERVVAWRSIASTSITHDTNTSDEQNSNNNGNRNSYQSNRAERVGRRTCITMERTRYCTYAELWERIVAFGWGLRSLGFSQGSMVGICEQTRWEWLVVSYAAWSQRCVLVVMGDDKRTAKSVAAEVKLSALICNHTVLPQLQAVFAGVNTVREMPVFIVMDAPKQYDVRADISTSTLGLSSLLSSLETRRTTMETTTTAEAERDKPSRDGDHTVTRESVSEKPVVLTWENVLTRGRGEWGRQAAARAEERRIRREHGSEVKCFHVSNSATRTELLSVSIDMAQQGKRNSTDTTLWSTVSGKTPSLLLAARTRCSETDGWETGSYCCRHSLEGRRSRCSLPVVTPLTNTIFISKGEEDGNDDEETFSSEQKHEEQGEDEAVLHFPKCSSELALVMYKNGDAKGVMLSHGALKAAVVTYQERLDIMRMDADYRLAHAPIFTDRRHNTSTSTTADTQRMREAEERPTYLSYLPMSSIMEFVSTNVFLHRGYFVCYGTPLTLYHRPRDIMIVPQSDLCEFKPLVFMSVPQVLDELQGMLEATLPSGGFLFNVFNVAYAERRLAILRCLETPFLNKTVFDKPRALLGGRCRVVVCGAAPLRADTQKFLEVVCGVAVLRGYGLTESAGCGTLQYMWDPQWDCVGGLLGGVEMKLRDVGPWRHSCKSNSTNTNNNSSKGHYGNKGNHCSMLPSGEVLLRGPTLMSGYYAHPGETARVFDNDGWLHTGDIVEVQCNGALRVIARIRNLSRNVCGEGINLEALERLYGGHPLCSPNGVCVLVHPRRSYIVALVLTDERGTCAFLHREPALSQWSWPDLLQELLFHHFAAISLVRFALERGVRPHHCVRAVRVLSDVWSFENGARAASGAIRRRVIEHRYAGVIRELFQENE